MWDKANCRLQEGWTREQRMMSNDEPQEKWAARHRPRVILEWVSHDHPTMTPESSQMSVGSSYNIHTHHHHDSLDTLVLEG